MFLTRYTQLFNIFVIFGQFATLNLRQYGSQRFNYNAVLFFQSDFDDTFYNITTQLPPLEDKNEFYQLNVSVYTLLVCVVA